MTSASTGWAGNSNSSPTDRPGPPAPTDSPSPAATGHHPQPNPAANPAHRLTPDRLMPNPAASPTAPPCAKRDARDREAPHRPRAPARPDTTRLALTPAVNPKTPAVNPKQTGPAVRAQ